MIFVFGSNVQGKHGAGAALYALNHEGAIKDQGFGRQGNSFGIPTREILRAGNRLTFLDLTLEEVKGYVDQFIAYAKANPTEEFKVTQIGTGYAGFKHAQMAMLFSDAPSNCLFDEAWKQLLGEQKRYWGTYK